MPKAIDVAKKLTMFAERIEKLGDMEVPTIYLDFSCYKKDEFIALVKSMPKPAKKSTTDYGGAVDPDFLFTHRGEEGSFIVRIPQHLTCRLVQPAQAAKYECDPIFEDESEMMEAAQS